MLCMELLIPYMLLIQYMGVREAGYKLLSPGVVRQLKAGAWGGMGAAGWAGGGMLAGRQERTEASQPSQEGTSNTFRSADSQPAPRALMRIGLVCMNSSWASGGHGGLRTGSRARRRTGTPEKIREEASSRTGFLSSSAVE